MNAVRCEMKNIMKSSNMNQEKLHPFPHILLENWWQKQSKVEEEKKGVSEREKENKVDLIAYWACLTSFHPLKNAWKMKMVVTFCNYSWIVTIIFCKTSAKYRHQDYKPITNRLIKKVKGTEEGKSEVASPKMSIVYTFKTCGTNILFVSWLNNRWIWFYKANPCFL